MSQSSSTTITELSAIASLMAPAARACKLIPASADGEEWVTIAAGAQVRVSALRALHTAYQRLEREIERRRTPPERTRKR